uniref:UBIQUITIN_CONJUGAT_2 domain-containing protein n=1 Tax=Mesocestoides corti TaxID=53468 RepID=A0A5K3FY33_MESCO
MSHSMGQRSFFKDVQQLYRKIDTSTDGQASIVSVNELSVIVSLNPKFGRNAHAAFIVNIDCPSAYPKASPEACFITPIFHPDINVCDGSVCLSLFDEWHSCYSLLDVVKGLIYLIEHPNFDFPDGDFEKNEKLFTKKTMRLLAGLSVNGRRVPPNQAWCEWAEANGCLPLDDEELEYHSTDVGDAVHVEAQQEPNKRIESFPGIATNAHDVKADQKTHHRFSDASSDTVPSFAKIRFFLDSLSGTSSWTYYVQDYYCIYFKSQRILIGQPSVNNKISLPSVFYYSEFLGNPDHRCKLGDLYGTLFAGDVLPAMQVHPESRQTSSLCPWYHFYYNSYLSFLTIESVFNLTNLFTYTEPRRESRGSDFSLDDDDGEDLAQVASESLAMGGDFYVDAELENSPQIVESRELAFDAEYKDEEEDDDDEEVEQQPAVEVEMQNMPIKDASSAASSKTYPLKS